MPPVPVAAFGCPGATHAWSGRDRQVTPRVLGCAASTAPAFAEHHVAPRRCTSTPSASSSRAGDLPATCALPSRTRPWVRPAVSSHARGSIGFPRGGTSFPPAFPHAGQLYIFGFHIEQLGNSPHSPARKCWFRSVTPSTRLDLYFRYTHTFNGQHLPGGRGKEGFWVVRVRGRDWGSMGQRGRRGGNRETPPGRNQAMGPSRMPPGPPPRQAIGGV